MVPLAAGDLSDGGRGASPEGLHLGGGTIGVGEGDSKGSVGEVDDGENLSALQFS